MKKITLTGLVFAMLGTIVIACKDKEEEPLYWTDPPTSADTLYQNPLFEPDLADPSFIRVTDTDGNRRFYAYGTQNTWYSGAAARLTPIITSKNLTKWEVVGDAFTADSKPAWHDGGLWAPQIVQNETDGKFYLYYSNSKWGDSNPGVGVAVSDYPYGPFADKGKVLDAQSSGVANAIDQFYIIDGTGRNKKSYLFWGSFQGIYGQEISSDMKTLTGSKFQIAGRGFEGSYIFKHGDKYWYFASSNSCCEGPDTKYYLSVASASNIKGPYYTKEGIDIKTINDFQAAQSTKFLVGDGVHWIGPGHNAEIIVDDHGRYFMLYHAVAVEKPYIFGNGGATRRPLMMDEVLWGEDGWPYIQGGVPSHTQKTAPYFESQN